MSSAIINKLSAESDVHESLIFQEGYGTIRFTVVSDCILSRTDRISTLLCMELSAEKRQFAF